MFTLTLWWLALVHCRIATKFWCKWSWKTETYSCALELQLNAFNKHSICLVLCVFKSKDPSLNPRSMSKPRVNDGLKMRASVRMTRYLESWGAVKPFAHLQSREGFTTDTNGKPLSKVNKMNFLLQ